MNDINMEQGIIKVIGKGNKERLVRIGLKTQKALWGYLARRGSNSDTVWIGKDNMPFTATGPVAMQNARCNPRLVFPMPVLPAMATYSPLLAGKMS